MSEGLPTSLDLLPEILTIEELAPLLRMSRSSAYEYARRDLLPIPVIRCGRRMYVSKTALMDLLREGKRD